MKKFELQSLLNQRLRQPSAQGIAEPAWLAVHGRTNVAQALHMAQRKAGVSDNTLFLIYVVDAERRLLGSIRLSDLQAADPAQPVTELVGSKPGYARTHWPGPHTQDQMAHHAGI